MDWSWHVLVRRMETNGRVDGKLVVTLPKAFT